ncbi:hypothetical protein D9M70_515850 [compost metagenome]
MLVRLERGRQLQALHVVLGQRVVGGPNAVLHGHVQAGRGLAAARHADQDQVGLVVVVGTGAVVVVEGEVHRLDALHVVGVAGNGVRFAHRVGGVRAELLFQRREEGREDVDHEPFGLRQNIPDFLVDHGVEDDRAGPVFLRSGVDLLYHGARFFNAVDVRSGQLVERDRLELRQQALAQCFGGDAGAVGDEESGSFHLRLGP